MSAPKLRPGTPMEVRPGENGQEARTPASRWHRAKQWWLRHHLTREDNGEWRDESGWGGRRTRVERRGRRTGLSREELREDVRLAQHAQQLREEAVTKGGKEERARFYGTGEFAGAGAGAEESKITVAKAERARAAYEAEQAAEYAASRRRTRAEFRLPWEG